MSLYKKVEEPDGLFVGGESWKDEWKNMPEFIQEKQREYAKITVRFRNQQDLDEFAKLIGQKLNRKSQCTWHPELKLNKATEKRYVDDSEIPNLHREQGPVGEQTDK